MAKAVTCHVIEAHLHYEFGSQRFPFAASFGAPTARTPWRLAGEAGRLAQSFEALREPAPFKVTDRRSVADVVQFALLLVKPEQ